MSPLRAARAVADALAIPSLFSPPNEPIIRRPPTVDLPPVVEMRKRAYAEGEPNWGSAGSSGGGRQWRHFLYRNMVPPVPAKRPPAPLTPMRWGLPRTDVHPGKDAPSLVGATDFRERSQVLTSPQIPPWMRLQLPARPR